MSQVDNYRRQLASLREKEASLRKDFNRYESDANSAKAEANKQNEYARRASSASSQKSYLNAAERAQKKGTDAGKKAAEFSGKLAQNAKEQARIASHLDSAEKSEQRAKDRETKQRQQKELDHTRQVKRLSSLPVVRYVHLRPPTPEKLRVLYMTANPGGDLMTENEVRQVQQALRGAKYRDRVEVKLCPAATFQDLLDGLNDVRPHIVHFSGHASTEAIELDRGGMEPADGVGIRFELIMRALAATDTPPELLVLNACYSLEAAAVILPAVPVVIGMSDEIPDTAAIVFSQQFYAAIAAGQSVGSAMRQAKVAIEAVLLDGDAAALPEVKARDDVSVDALVLVKPDL